MNFIRRLFGVRLPAPEAPAQPTRTAPTLRNRPGGLAWIVAKDIRAAAALHGRIVRTTAIGTEGHWLLDPPQEFVALADLTYRGRKYPAGTEVWVTGARDERLIPIANPGDEEQDESRAWLPPVPAATSNRERA